MRHLLPFVASLAALLSSCAGSSVTPMRTDLAPLPKGAAFVVAPIEMSPLTVDGKPEEEFLAEKPDEREKWAAIKQDISDTFAATLRSKAADAGFQVGAHEAGALTIRSRTSSIETGYYRIPAFQAIARISLEVSIVDADGNVLEELLVEAQQPWDGMVTPTTAQRLNGVATRLGNELAAYLKTRVAR